MNKENFVIVALSIALGLLVGGLIFSNYSIEIPSTGAATTVDSNTTATIAAFFAINASTNLTSGIRFDITSLPYRNANASANYLNASGGGIGGGTTDANNTFYFVTVELDSNVNVDFCITANASLYSGSNFINVTGNYSFANATVNNVTDPRLATQRHFNENATYKPVSQNRAVNQADYYRFWLNVSSAQAAGTYTNQIRFKGVQTSNLCNP
jgi:hypothetical protein